MGNFVCLQVLIHQTSSTTSSCRRNSTSTWSTQQFFSTLHAQLPAVEGTPSTQLSPGVGVHSSSCSTPSFSEDSPYSTSCCRRNLTSTQLLPGVFSSSCPTPSFWKNSPYSTFSFIRNSLFSKESNYLHSTSCRGSAVTPFTQHNFSTSSQDSSLQN